MRPSPFIVAAATSLALSCADADPDPRQPVVDGPAVAIDIAALGLDAVADAVWDIRVTNGPLDAQGEGADTVFAVRITASGFGSGASASYVGPCDASAPGDNAIYVRLIGIYDRVVAAPGGWGATAPADALEFVDPGELARFVACRDGQDAFVRFDVTVMRPARQGFFDIAVNFEDIFCSAKFDCDGGPLLHNADVDGAPFRDTTYVIGFACTAGSGGDAETSLFLDAVAVECADAVAQVDPSGGDGNLCELGDVAGCGPRVIALGDVLYQAAVYAGLELLGDDGDLGKRYWNVALGVARSDLTGCRLRSRGTAARGLLPSGGQALGDGVVYPFVRWDIDLGAACPGAFPVVFPGGEAPSCATAPCPAGYYDAGETPCVCAPAVSVAYTSTDEQAAAVHFMRAAPLRWAVDALVPPHEGAPSVSLAIHELPSASYVQIRHLASGGASTAAFARVPGSVGGPIALTVCGDFPPEPVQPPELAPYYRVIAWAGEVRDLDGEAISEPTCEAFASALDVTLRWLAEDLVAASVPGD